MKQQLPIKRLYLSHLVDNLNADNVFGSEQDASKACDWLGYCSLCMKMMKNPILYRVSCDIFLVEPSLEEQQVDLVYFAIVALDKNNLVKYN